MSECGLGAEHISTYTGKQGNLREHLELALTRFMCLSVLTCGFYRVLRKCKSFDAGDANSCSHSMLERQVLYQLSHVPSLSVTPFNKR